MHPPLPLDKDASINNRSVTNEVIITTIEEDVLAYVPRTPRSLGPFSRTAYLTKVATGMSAFQIELSGIYGFIGESPDPVGLRELEKRYRGASHTDKSITAEMNDAFVGSARLFQASKET